VSRLVLVLSDLPAARLSEPARATLPRLPLLERWLARGHSERASGGWRPWLQRTAHEPALHSVPLASIAAAARSNPPDARPVWFATPVHLVAGLDTVRVHPAGVLQLAWDEQQALEQDFAKVFAGSGWSLYATGRRELLLAGGTPQASGMVRSCDPVLWLGADPRAGLPAGPGADGLRRLGAEMEMWLYEHQLNAQRLARQQLSANALWIWGGGAPAIAGPTGATPRSTGAIAWAEDLFLDGLARLEGYAVEPLPECWPQSALPAGKPGAALLAVCRVGATPDERTLERLDRNWIAPAFEHWRGGGVQRATLLAGEHAVTLERSVGRMFWRSFRRTRPWWESLLPC
jgi:hypothetical protein